MSRRKTSNGAALNGLLYLALATMCIGALTACSSSTPSTSAGPRSHRTTTTSHDPATKTSTTRSGKAAPTTMLTAPSAPSAPPAQSASVKTLTLDLTDTSRPTVRFGETVAATRHLPTTVYLPADASGRVTGSSLPWLIFLHGYNDIPDSYGEMLHRWVRAGYAVAAPILPLTSSQGSFGLDEADMVNEPADVSFLIDSLLAQSARADTPLTGRLDAKRIGIAGHSDGANVAFSSGYSQNLGDRRVVAVIDLAGELPTGMGPFSKADGGPPLLMIAGDRDGNVPVERSRELYESIGVRRWWVELHDIGHAAAFTEVNAWSKVVDDVSVAFLDVTLGRYDVDAATIEAFADQPPLATLEGRSAG